VTSGWEVLIYRNNSEYIEYPLYHFLSMQISDRLFSLQ
jgi:hypothetical protein